MHTFTPLNSEDRVTFRSLTITITILYAYSYTLLCTLSPAYGVVYKQAQTTAQITPSSTSQALSIANTIAITQYNSLTSDRTCRCRTLTTSSLTWLTNCKFVVKMQRHKSLGSPTRLNSAPPLRNLLSRHAVMSKL